MTETGEPRSHGYDRAKQKRVTVEILFLLVGLVFLAFGVAVVRFKDSISSNPPSYRTGEVVGVFYDPDHPRDARIDRGRWNKAVPILIGGSGVFLCFLGLWILKRRTPATSRTPS